ncbi:hypothetical protein L6452_00907 [Arctium lappa]|uniref:Uncharacterized protein n=1 Tax=Arctium lappa TaxID=4217 RepID=A0ACB9FEN9_ARCLA|nr:hypothetical protein L6452_00907 [Arctium lappa]
MGGAMASSCGLDLMLINGSKNVQLMTIGQPRIGNVAFASYYSEHVPNTFRVTHEHDMVPHLPPYYHYFPEKTHIIIFQESFDLVLCMGLGSSS